MPPKKKTADSAEAAASGETKFSWTPENDRTLLLLSLGRNIGPADYEKFVSALPAGANFQGVRQRVSRLRGEQKKKYEDMGWELSSEATAKPKGPAASKKRKGGGEDGGDGAGGEGKEGEALGRVKKARAKKGEKSEEVVMDEEGGEEREGEEGIVEEESVEAEV